MSGFMLATFDNFPWSPSLSLPYSPIKRYFNLAFDTIIQQGKNQIIYFLRCFQVL